MVDMNLDSVEIELGEQLVYDVMNHDVEVKIIEKYKICFLKIFYIISTH